MNKMIVLDLDGTTLRKDKTVSKYTIETLLECVNSGIKVLFATARPPRDAYKYVPVELRNNPIICYNAACIINKDKEVLFKNEILKKDVLEIIKICKQFGYDNLCIEVNDKLFSNFDTSYFFGSAKTEIVDLEKMDFQSAYKFIICSKEKIGEEILKFLPNSCKGIITDNGSLCQIISAQASKWKSIENLISKEGIDKKDVIAFGDDYNDLDMIKNAGIGVAMENSEEEIKNVANYITESNQNDGVAKFLKEKILRK